MRIGVSLLLVAVILLTLGMLTMSGWDRPPVESAQRGFRGLGMVAIENPRTARAEFARQQVPEAAPPAPSGGPRAADVYQNVEVLGDLSVPEFSRLMTAITEWVSPEQGCTYCHAEGGDFASDSVYTKIVSRRMLQMTQHINANWQDHVAETGVTCYTCHRGQNVPAYIWFTGADPDDPRGLVGNQAGQNAPAPSVGLASLPEDPFAQFLAQQQERDAIRVVSNTALPTGNRKSIKQTEWTYALMMHFSDSLGVNCTYCHNTRSFMSWDQSTPQRAIGWYGIRMVSDLNQNYLEPLGPQYPHDRLGPLGDAPKANCATCHQGVYKPLYGASMLDDYPSLAGPGDEGTATSMADDEALE